MPPAEDAALLLAIVQRHLKALELSLESAFPEEDWGFTAQQLVEKRLKALIVLDDRRPPRQELLALLEEELGRCERMVAALGESAN